MKYWECEFICKNRWKKIKRGIAIKISNDKKYEYYLSEIVFEIENNQILKKIQRN